MPINWNDYIVRVPDILHRKPCIKGTRIPVSLILGYLLAKYSFDQVIQEFPDLNEEQIIACLDYAHSQ